MVLPTTYTLKANFSSAYSGYARVGTAQVGHASDPGSARVMGAFGAGSEFTDLPRVIAFETRHGRDDNISAVTEGGFRVEVDDDDAALDPANAASPYYPNVKLRRLAKIEATNAGTAYTLGTGYVEDYQAERHALGANVAVGALDLFRRLAGWTVSASRPAEMSGERINALLSAIGYPSGARAIDAGTVTVSAVTLTNARPLEHLGDVVLAEQGLFFVDREGTPTFHDRWHRLKETSRGTFGAGGSLPVARVFPTFNARGVYNRARVTRTGGLEQAFEDPTSILDNDVIEYVLPTNAADLLPDDTAALDWATRLVRSHKDAQQRIGAVEVNPYSDDALWPLMLSAEVSDLFVLNHDLAGTKGITAQYVYVESVAHAVTVDMQHTVTLQLSNASQYAEQYAIVGHATRGKVGTARVG